MQATRRDVRALLRLVLLALLLAGGVASGQPAADKVWRIGILLRDRSAALPSITEGLRDRGYVEGRNLKLEVREAADVTQLARHANELAQMRPDLLVAVTGNAARALQSSTASIPIVMASSGDAVAQGLVASLARPGGNVTGFTVVSTDLAAKRLELLRMAAPQARRIGVVTCPLDDPVHAAQWSEIQPAAARMGLTLVPVIARNEEELAPAFRAALQRKPEAVLILDCSAMTQSARIAAIVNEARVPAVYHAARFAQAGGLISYGADLEDLYRRSADYVDRILRGARPGDLPVEQPTKFEMVVNRRTAKALDLRIPEVLLVRADRVIE